MQVLYVCYIYYISNVHVYLHPYRTCDLAVKEKNAEDTISNYEASSQFSAGV